MASAGEWDGTGIETAKDAQVEQRFVKARWGTATLFFTNGIVMASWASRVPAVQQHLRLSEGKLGLALLGMAVGGLIAMPITAWLLSRYDQQKIARLGTLLLCLALPLPAFAFNGISLFIALVILGAGSGAMNVAVNSQGNHIEAQFPRPIMASFHALFSLGGMVGALIGAGMASTHISPLVHLSIVTVCFVIAVLYATNFMLPVVATTSPSSATRPPLSHTLRALIGLGTIAFITVFIEGAISDWSAVYLRKEVGVLSGTAALGYAAFALTMLLGRATGDWLGARLGDRLLVRAGAIVGAAGLGMALLVGGLPATLIGFASVGIGCACVFPTLIRASSRVTNIPSSAAVASISTAGFMGFFVGPPLIGLLADHVMLRGALILLVAGNILIALLAGRLERRTETP